MISDSPELTHGSLFAGIGGFDLGFERAGIKTIWQVEIDPFCRKVLEKHWPHVQRYDDVTKCTARFSEFYRGDGYWLLPTDIVTGGFPCQDISNAGDCAGLDGDKSSLWWQMLRAIRVVGPKYVVVENVAALLDRGMEQVLGSLAHSGFDSEWDCLPACAFGAPHTRERVFTVAYPHGQLVEGRYVLRASPEEPWPEARMGQLGRVDGPEVWEEAIAELCREDDGLPAGLDRSRAVKHRRARLKTVGNSLKPQIAEWIGRRILEAERLTHDFR